MGLIDKLKKLASDDDYEEDTSDLETYEEESSPVNYTAPTTNSTSYSTDSYSFRNSNKVVNINATAQLQVVLVKPERFDDASSIADQLNNKRTVVLNLESTNKDVARRLVDFLSGVAYANNGQIKRCADKTFIITPYNVGIVGDDLLDELENNGFYF